MGALWIKSARGRAHRDKMARLPFLKNPCVWQLAPPKIVCACMHPQRSRNVTEGSFKLLDMDLDARLHHCAMP